MDPARQERREQIKRSLKFIRSSLPYPEPEAYQNFLTQLVCNLLDEGNDLLKEREWVKAVSEFDEGLNVSSYAAADDFHISEALLESLYVSRAAAYHNMGDYDQGIKDCDSALEVCQESHRALYRKAVCLKKLGKYKEAYNCTTDCMLISRLDKDVNELAEELAIQLGLKNRKPYISTKEDTLIPRDGTNVTMTAEATKEPDHLGNGVTPLSGLAPVPDTLDTCEDSELMGDDIDNLLDCFPTDLESAETAPERNIWPSAHIQAAFPIPDRTSISPHTAPSVLPPPTPQLPPAFFSSAVSKINALDFFTGGRSATTAVLDSLDDLSTSASGLNGGAPILGLGSVELDALDGLDSLDEFPDKTPSSAGGSAKYESKTDPEAGERSLDLLDDLDPLETVTDPDGLLVDVPKFDVKAVDQLDFFDALDLFPTVEGVVTGLPAVSVGKGGLDPLFEFSSNGIPASHNAAAPEIRSPKKNHKKKSNNQEHVTVANPLSSTHEFLQACSACFPRKGQGIYSFVHKPNLIHSCKRDILLCRRKLGHPSEWTRVRPIPTRTSFSGPFVLCNEIIKSGDLGLCKYGDECTFAYNQLEIDVWTAERKGMLHRHLLFEPASVKLDPVISVICLLREHKGMFIFLCQECYDHKPRIISKRCKDRYTICSNLSARHNFDANKCLAFMVKNPSTNYSKVRPLRLLCNFDLCDQAVWDSCQREHSCDYAHSVIELKTWMVQRDTGISPSEIVKVSTKYYEQQEQDSGKHKGRLSSGDGGSKRKERGARKSLNMKMMFACAQCWRDGLNSEPDKALKYCTAKARHTWAKDRCLLLVNSLERSKWVPVRPLPHAKNFPVHYDICTHILEKRKCNYTGKCTFAHSREEKEMWTYMKNNNLVDMEQVYDKWLTTRTHNGRADGATLNKTVPEEVQKDIVMPTDYAEPTSGFHCHLCGKHSNGERQWQQHISSEKHIDRVFNCVGEDEALTWNYRFPGTCFKLCPKLDGCPDGVSCDYAHSPEELQEWTERRDFLRQKVAKAREDSLVMPDGFDFGKYNYLLQD